MDRKRILIAIALTIFVVLIGIALYVVFFRPAFVPEAPPTPPVNLVPVNIPPITGVNVAPPGPPAPPVNAPPSPVAPSLVATGGITAVTPITATPATFTRLTSSGTLQYYDPTTQRFYRIGADGRTIALSAQTFPNVQRVAWAPNGDRGILEFPDGANILYDFSRASQTTLPAAWEDFSFAPDGSRIAAKRIAVDRENQWLFEADADGGNTRVIEPLGRNADRVAVSWAPHNQVIAFARTGETLGDGRQQILLIGRNGENFPGLTIEGQQFRPQWSPSGASLLYSAVDASNEYKPELWVVDGAGDAIGGNRRRLRVDTWADKCTFADDVTLYCAVPDRLERGYGLEPQLAARVSDTIERIDLTTGLRSVVGKPEDGTSVRDVIIAPDGRSLYYTAARDGRLYEMKLR